MQFELLLFTRNLKFKIFGVCVRTEFMSGSGFRKFSRFRVRGFRDLPLTADFFKKIQNYCSYVFVDLFKIVAIPSRQIG